MLALEPTGFIKPLGLPLKTKAGGMRRSEEARVSEEAVRRKGGGGVQGIGNGLRMERPRSPCQVRENLRQIGRAQGEVRKPKCQRKED
jgi:hypothetical protein